MWCARLNETLVQDLLISSFIGKLNSGHIILHWLFLFWEFILGFIWDQLVQKSFAFPPGIICWPSFPFPPGVIGWHSLICHTCRQHILFVFVLDFIIWWAFAFPPWVIGRDSLPSAPRAVGRHSLLSSSPRVIRWSSLASSPRVIRWSPFPSLPPRVVRWGTFVQLRVYLPWRWSTFAFSPWIIWRSSFAFPPWIVRWRPFRLTESRHWIWVRKFQIY